MLQFFCYHLFLLNRFIFVFLQTDYMASFRRHYDKTSSYAMTVGTAHAVPKMAELKCDKVVKGGHRVGSVVQT